MMIRHTLLAAAVFTTVLAGCNKRDEAPATPPPASSPAEPAAPPATPAPADSGNSTAMPAAPSAVPPADSSSPAPAAPPASDNSSAGGEKK